MSLEISLGNIDKVELPFKYKLNSFEESQEQKAPEKVFYAAYPKYVEQLWGLKINYSPNLEDESLTRFMELAKPSRIASHSICIQNLKIIKSGGMINSTVGENWSVDYSIFIIRQQLVLP